MICPHCQADTPATDRYCTSCGLAVDLEFENVAASFEAESESRAYRETEERTRAWLFSALTALAIVLLARWLLVPAKPEVLLVPTWLAPADPRATAVEPLPLPRLDLDIPKK
jgi:hypothetical protein